MIAELAMPDPDTHMPTSAVQTGEAHQALAVAAAATDAPLGASGA